MQKKYLLGEKIMVGKNIFSCTWDEFENWIREQIDGNFSWKIRPRDTKENREAIKSTISKGKQALVAMLRTQNMNPPRLYAEEIAESVMNLYSSEANQSIELLFDDKDYFLNIMEL